MRKKILVGLATGFFLIGMVGMANATSIKINNHSFENDINLNYGNPIHGYWNYDIGEWDDNPLGGAGTWEPFSFLSPLAPDGDKVAYINNGSLYQELDAALMVGEYSLMVDVGWRLDQSLPSFAIQLLAGNNLLASFSDSSGLTQGTWTPTLLTYNATPFDSYLGENLGIRLIKTASGQVNFDNVRLDTTQVPEPATILLICTGLVGLVGPISRRKEGER